MITASMVIYHNDREDLEKSIKSALKNKQLDTLYVIDNSKESQNSILPKHEKIRYLYSKGKNLGFGRGHNIALRKAISKGSNYHVILNPDIYFDENVFIRIRELMEKRENIGLVMPKIKFPNGEIQNLVKLLPTPFDLFQRRFLPRWEWAEKLNSRYEMDFADKGVMVESPYLSGCFMFIRTEALKKVGLFDKNIFMYSEDLDLTRRIHKKYKTVMHPEVEVYHKWERGSYKDKKLLMEQIKANIYYFNKYGWFIDKDREKTNKKIISKHLKVMKK